MSLYEAKVYMRAQFAGETVTLRGRGRGTDMEKAISAAMDEAGGKEALEAEGRGEKDVVKLLMRMEVEQLG